MLDLRSAGPRRTTAIRVTAIVAALAAWASASAQSPLPASYGHVATWDVPGALMEPLDVALGPGGLVYIADGRRNSVQVFDADGDLVARWQRQGAVAFCDPLVPFAVAVDATAQRVYSGWHCYERGSLSSSAFYLDARDLDGSNPAPLVLVRAVGAADLDVYEPTGALVVAGARTVWLVQTSTGAATRLFDLAGWGGSVTRLAVAGDLVHLARPGLQEVERVGMDGSALPSIKLPGRRVTGLGGATDGRLAVLVAAITQSGWGRPTPPPPDGTLILLFDGGIEPTSSIMEAEVGAGIPGGSGWRWAADLSDEGVAFTAASDRFEVHRLNGDRTAHRRMLGGPVRPWFVPRAWTPRHGTEAFAVAADGSGGAAVLDSVDGLLMAFDAAGLPRVLGEAPASAVDIAAAAPAGPAEPGAVFVSGADDRLRRVEADGSPGWDVPCACDLGGRLASQPGVLHVTRPRAQQIAQFDPLTGAMLGVRTHEGTVGLWPSDVAAGGGRLIASQIATGRVQDWADDGSVTEWEAGVLTGPRRLGLGPQGAAVVLTVDGWLEVHDEDGSLHDRFVPRLDDGRSIEVWDVDMGPSGRIFVADAPNRAVHVFDPDSSPVIPVPSPSPTVLPTPSAKSCTVALTKDVEPRRAIAGSSVTVTLGFSSACPDGAPAGYDVVLAIDASSSMAGVRMQAAQAAAQAFVERLDVRHHRVGVVSFNEDAKVVVPVTRDVAAVIDGIRSLTANGRSTNLSAALERSDAALAAASRPGAVPVIILLSDGNHTGAVRSPGDVAAAARERGTLIFTIGLTTSQVQLLLNIAGDPDRYYPATSPEMLMSVYGRILARLTLVVPGSLVVVEEPALPVFVDSVDPEGLTGPGGVIWRRVDLPEAPWLMRYSARAEGEGSVDVSRRSDAAYTDGDGARRVAGFPTALLEVVTATPIAPTPTPTPRAWRAWLPMLLNASCAFADGADVALVLDVSASMGESLGPSGTKLDAARTALAGMAARRTSADRLALVTFGDQARVLHRLTDPAGSLVPALNAAGLEGDSRLDLGLAAARAELAASTVRQRAIVVLTDGRVSPGDPQDAFLQADAARAEGVTVYAVGLGATVDVAALRRVASGDLFYWASDQPDLESVYASIAGALRCRPVP